jgi:Uri superfamily endonuclease
LEAVWFEVGARREHEWAAEIGLLPGVVPMPGFGSSDCGCEVHLFWFAKEPQKPAGLDYAHAAVVH